MMKTEQSRFIILTVIFSVNTEQEISMCHVLCQVLGTSKELSLVREMTIIGQCAYLVSAK